MTYEIIHKPTFQNQLLALQNDRLRQVLEKIRVLEEDPRPHGDVKKKLHGYSGNVYRLRSGDVRVLYTYGDGWVTLLGVDLRKDVYRGNRLHAEEPECDVSAIPDLSGALEVAKSPPRAVAAPELAIDRELVGRLRIPDEYATVLLACRTIDDLIAAPVPEAIRERVFDCATRPDYGQVLAQPDLVTGEIDDLLRFSEGELLGFLLKLDPEQEGFVRWGLGKGPTLVKGGPGSGKSTIALYRTRALLDRWVGKESPRILFATYTNALVTASAQLLRRLLGDRARLVEVRTADSVLLDVLHRSGEDPQLASAQKTKSILRAAIEGAQFQGNALEKKAQERTIERLGGDYLLEEIGTIIEGRAIDSLEAYLEAPRPGRRIALSKTQRQAVWAVREAFRARLADEGQSTWHVVRRRAAEVIAAGRGPLPYDGVVLDEVQDLDAIALRALVGLCREPDGLFVTADANQSIYRSGFRWQDVHERLRFQGRTGVLRANYRNTAEISRAASSYLARGGAMPEESAPEDRFLHEGPRPIVRTVAQPRDETALLARFLRQAARAFRLGFGASSILVPTQDAGERVAARLAEEGLEARFMGGRELDLERQAVKVLTLKSAKGLEFPIVAIAGFLEGKYPVVPKGASPEEVEETTARERRTLYVAMTRAMRALLVVLPSGKESDVFTGFDPAVWDTGITPSADVPP